MTDIALFKDSAVTALPDYLKVDADTLKVAGNTRTYRRISIEGGVWRMVVSGKEVGKNTDRHLDVVIVRASGENSRTFYEGTYQRGVKTPPTCFSHDGVKPDPKSTKPQASFCAQCPQNIKGSGQGESRACRYSRRLAVVLANDIAGSVFNLSVPAASLFGNDNAKKSLQQYARTLAAHNVGMNAVVTRLHFDLDASTPKLIFEPIRPLTKDEYDTVQQQRDNEEARAAVETAVHEQDGVSAAPTDSRVQGTMATPATDGAPAEPVVRGANTAANTAAPASAEEALAQWAQSDD